MSALLRIFLMRLAHWHMVLALLVTLYVVSPLAIWTCEGESKLFCVWPKSIWNLQHVFVESIAYSVQALIILTVCLNLGSVIMSTARVYGDVVAVLDASTFALGIVPWALVLGFRKEAAHGRIGGALYIDIAISFVHMVAASLTLTAILMPNEEKCETERVLIDRVESQQKLPLLLSGRRKEAPRQALIALEVFSYVALASALASIGNLYALDSDTLMLMGAKGCQLAVVLLAFDSALVSALVRRRTIEISMGSIVAASMALGGWIVGIVSVVLITLAVGEFGISAVCSLVSLLASVVVFSIGIYLGTLDVENDRLV